MARKKYSPEIVEYIKLRCETISSDIAIAREVIKRFDVTSKLSAVRVKVGDVRSETKTVRKKRGFKRLFFDIETSYYTAKPIFHTGKMYMHADLLHGEKKIICISYKWQFGDQVHTISWDKNQDDKKLLKEFIKVLNEADEVIAHNSDNFDIKELRTRCFLQGVHMFPKYRTFDTLKKSRSYFRFPSNRLDYLGKAAEVGRKLDNVDRQLWIDCTEGKTKALVISH